MSAGNSRGRRFISALAVAGALLAQSSPLAAGKIGLHIGLHFGHYAHLYGFHHYGDRPYHRHRCYHDGRRHGSDHRPIRRHPSVRAAAPERYPAPGVVAVFTGGNGWALLREGKSRDAQAAFGGEAARRPGSGQPKAGFAIASALSGDHVMAAWSMRRALRLDPDGVRQLELEASLHRTALLLIDDYASAGGAELDRRHALIMQAALHYLLREQQPARRALEAAVALGENNPGADNLRKLIDSLETVG